MFYWRKPQRLIAPHGTGDHAHSLARNLGWPVTIGKTDKDNEFGLYGVGFGAMGWAGKSREVTVPVKLTLPIESKPVRMTAANLSTFAVLLDNGETYFYATPDTITYKFYGLGGFSSKSSPVRHDLGLWEDISVSPYGYAVDVTNNANVVPYVLTSTEKHERSPRDTGFELLNLSYNTTGNGFFTTKASGSTTFQSFVLASGVIIKKMAMHTEVATRKSCGLLYTTDGLYVLSSTYTCGTQRKVTFAATKVTFPYGTIKKAWVPYCNVVFVQNTNNDVYKGIVDDSTGALTWTSFGTWNVKHIAEANWSYNTKLSGSAVHCLMLTNDGKLYYNGPAVTTYIALPASTNTFTQLYDGFRFDNIAYSQAHVSLMGIGWKA